MARETLLPFFEPMMARLVKQPLPGKWQYEIKYDGFRALAFLSGGSCRLMSRNGKDFGARFPEIMRSLVALKVDNTILDGEIVAVDAKGVSSFQLLQAHEMGHTLQLAYYVFDLPQHNGEDLRGLPLEDRRHRLQKLLRGRSGPLRLSEGLKGDGNALLVHAQKLGLEGLIGKKEGSLYEAGRRTGAWIKLKTHREQEFVIGAYTDPTGSRASFGAILVGVYRQDKLVFCGKIGTGFNVELLESLYDQFQRILTPDCPFENLQGRVEGLSPAQARRCHWLKPKLVCQVRFSEWTRDGKLRQPVFLGLRDDKNPRDVIREEPS